MCSNQLQTETSIIVEEYFMNKQEQLSAIRKALELTDRISKLQATINNISNQSTIKQPQPPVRETVKSQYPAIKSNVKFSWLIALVPIAVIWVLSALVPVVGALLLFISPAWIAVYYFVIYKPQKDADVEKMRTSEQYRQQCAAIDIENQRRQAELDEKYQAAMKEYNEVILPKYQEDVEELQKQHEKEIKKAQQELNTAKQELAEHYEKTQIVPKQYRNYEALMYINTALSMSASSVDEAIALYEEDCDRRANVSYDDVSFRDIASGGNSSGGHGILSGIYRSATSGNGNRGNETSKRNSGKQSLWGTAMCPYGKRAKEYNPNAPDFATIHCGIGCPMWSRCGGK